MAQFKDKDTISRQPHELEYEAKLIGCTPSLILLAIESVGNKRKNVEDFIIDFIAKENDVYTAWFKSKGK